MQELLLPRTDAGVAAQAVVVVLGLGVTWWRARHTEVRILVLGVGLVLLALFGLRALH